MKKLLICGLLAAGMAAAQSVVCPSVLTKADVTAACALMPYKMLSAALPGVFGTAKPDAVQLWIAGGDAGVIAYRVTVRLAGDVDRVVFVSRIGGGALVEVPVPDLSAVRLESLGVEKLRADPTVAIVAGTNAN